MKTLIELYDDRAIENVLGPETFRPEEVIYLCPEEIARDKGIQESYGEFFRRRGLKLQTEFRECSLYRADKVADQLRRISEKKQDVALDVTGGSDAALVGAGMFCQESGAPTFTYSRRQNRFYNIANAPFADKLSCTLSYSVEDFFAMAGGKLRPGRVDNQVLARYMPGFDAFFRVFLKHRHSWARDISYLQRASQNQAADAPLRVDCGWELKCGHGSHVPANPELLSDLQSIGYLHDLTLTEASRVSFSFADGQIRAWLRDVGSVLELYTYKSCLKAACFEDVVCSAIVDWGSTAGKQEVSNEIDVVAARGIKPLFISCKVCEVKTEALNELAILRDRFGGKGASAVIVTTEPCGSAARHRAAQLGLAVIDLEEIQANRVPERLQVIMKVRESLSETD